MTQISLPLPQSDKQPSSTSPHTRSDKKACLTSTRTQTEQESCLTSTHTQTEKKICVTSTHAQTEKEPYSTVELREVLTQWHRASPEERPEPFPGPLATKEQLTSWVYNVRKRAEDRGIPRQQWANALISWIPPAAEGKRGFREGLLDQMRGKRASGEWEKGRFWKWEKFRYLFVQMCADKLWNNRVVVGLAGTVAAAALPIVGIPVLGALGFTTAGIASGSAAAGAQSLFYGGFTGGVFSALQSMGARAAIPIGYNVAVGVIGGKAAAVATAYDGNQDIEDDSLGDIGDDGDDDDI